MRAGALDPPLPWKPDDRWPDFEQFAGPIGRPRILSLDREDYYHPRRIVLRHLRLLPNPNYELASASSLGADWLEFEDVAGPYITLTISKDVRLRRVRGEVWEPDKMIETLVMEDCDATEHFGGATGVLSFLARDCRFANDCRGAGPDMEFEGCTFTAAPDADYGIWRFIEGRAVPRLVFRKCTFDATGSPGLLHAINPGPDNSEPGLLPMVEVVELLPGGEVAVRPVGRWETDPNKLWGDMAEGQPLMDSAGLVKGHVLGLYSDGRPVVQVKWLEPPVVGARYQSWLIFGRFDCGGNTVTGRDVPLWRGKFESVDERSPPGRVILDD